MNDRNRRTFLKATGAATTAMLMAGCSSDDGDGDGGDGDGNGDNGGGDGASVDDWEGVTELYFEGQISHWGGVEPSHIDGGENPTVILFEGQDYEVTWENADGVVHDFTIVDENGDIVEDYQSDEVGTEGETATLEFTATAEMAQYICTYHRTTQVGDLQIESE